MHYIFLGDNIYDYPDKEEHYEYLTDEQVEFYLKNRHRNPTNDEVRALMMDEDRPVDIETYRRKACSAVDEAVARRIDSADRNRLLDAVISAMVGQLETADEDEESMAGNVDDALAYLAEYDAFRKEAAREAARVKGLIMAGMTQREVDDALDGSSIENIDGVK